MQRVVSRVGVLGGGQMGSGIALVTAMTSKLPVMISDVSQDRLDGALQYCDKLLARNVEKGKMNQEDADATRGRLSTTLSLEQLAKESDFVIEAATENLTLKSQLFADLDKFASSDVILASNTSSISITKIAAATQRPDKVIGMHFFSPVPVMKICELITGLQTSNDTLTTTTVLAENMGKITTRSEDMPGFIANRILMPYINEAFLVLQEGTATPEDIDTTMKLGTAVPMGPLKLADFIGLDTCLSIMEVLHVGFGDSKYRPAPLLRKYVDSGLLGMKSKKGVYSY